MASFGIKEEFGYELEDGTSSYWQHFCGGSIVGDNVIITAAHCFNDEHDANIKLGDEYFNTPSDDELMKIYNITTIVKHPSYQGQGY